MAIWRCCCLWPSRAAERALPGPLDLSFPRGKRPGDGHSCLVFHVTWPALRSNREETYHALRSNREETCHLVAADFPHHSRYTRRCWMCCRRIHAVGGVWGRRKTPDSPSNFIPASRAHFG